MIIFTLKPSSPLPKQLIKRYKSTLITSKRLRSNLPNFNDLDGYLTHARSKQLKTDSTVFNGTSYELTCKESLQSFLQNVNLLHVGGGNDNGIDIYGKWRLDQFIDPNVQPKIVKLHDDNIIPIALSNDHSINLIIQCKNYSKKITAREIRELSGIFHAEFPNDSKNQSIVLFCAPSVMTKKGIEQLHSSNVPIGYFQISKMVKIKTGDKYNKNNYKGGIIEAFYANPLFEALLSGTSFLDYTRANIIQV